MNTLTRQLLVSIQDAGDAINKLARATVMHEPDPAIIGSAVTMMEQTAARLSGEDMSEFMPRSILMTELRKANALIKSQAAAMEAKDQFEAAQAAEMSRLQETVRALATKPRTMEP